MKGGTWTQHALTKPVFGTKAVKILSLTSLITNLVSLNNYYR